MKRLSNSLISLSLVLLTAAFLVIQGCKSDEVVTGGSDNTEISMMAPSGVTDDSPINTLVLDSVKVLLKNIKLNVSGGSTDSVNFKTGPFVVKLNLNTNVTLFTTAMIPEGTYDKVKFEIHNLKAEKLVLTLRFQWEAEDIQLLFMVNSI